MPSFSTKIFIEIRDEMKSMRTELSGRLDATNERLAATSERIESTNERLDTSPVARPKPNCASPANSSE